jgi:hypothetical membrane protein
MTRRNTGSSGRRAAAAWAGVAAQLVFTVYWLIAPLWQGGRYSVLEHSISDMYAVTAPAGTVMVVVLTVCGAATLVFVFFTLIPAVRSTGWAGWLGCILLALSIFGLGDLLTPFERLACRLADPGCTPEAQVANAGGQLDSTLSTIGIAFLITACVFLFIATRKVAGWSRTAVVMLTVAIAIAVVSVLLALFGQAAGGLLERVIALLGAGAIAVLAARSRPFGKVMA